MSMRATRGGDVPIAKIEIENEDAREFDLGDVERLVRQFQMAKQICLRSRDATTQRPCAVAVAGLAHLLRNGVLGDLQVMTIEEVIAEMKAQGSYGVSHPLGPAAASS